MRQPKEQAIQLVLPDWFPPEMPAPEGRIMMVSTILENLAEPLVGPEPNRALIDSIGRYGILHPLLLVGTGISYIILDGRRRLRAAIILGIASVAALVYQQHDVETASPALTLTVNENRAHNVWVEYVAIKTMLERGANERQVSFATGLSVPTIRLRMRLAKLHPFLRDLLAQGQITANAAQAAAKLSEVQQLRLVDLWNEKGKLTMTDIKGVRQAIHKEASASLADKLGDLEVEESEWDDGQSPEQNVANAKYARIWQALVKLVGPEAANKIAEGA